MKVALTLELNWRSSYPTLTPLSLPVGREKHVNLVINDGWACQ